MSLENKSLPTVEELQAQFDSLHYFTEDLTAKNEDDWVLAKDDQEMRTQLILEMLFVNKLQTIARYYEYLEQHKDESEFTKGIFKSRLTNKSAITDAFGMIPHVGSKLAEDGEFELYQGFYDSLYITETV